MFGMTRFIRRLGAVGVSWAGLSLLAGAANAAIVECRPVPGSYTVFLSEPAYTPDVFESKDQLRASMQQLHFELDQRRDGQWIRSPNTDVRFVLCPNRAPALDGQEFTPALIEALYNGRVLLEIWGRLDAERTSGRASNLSAQVNYLLVPMQYAVDLRETPPMALQRLEYPAAEDFVRLLSRSQDIDAFVAAAFGFKLLRERKYELAHRNLCRASALSRKIEQRQLGGRTKTDVGALRAFVLQSAQRAIDDAVKNPEYSLDGQLRLQDRQDPCAEEEGRRAGSCFATSPGDCLPEIRGRAGDRIR